MKRFSLSIVLLPTILVASCVVHQPDLFPDNKFVYVAVENVVEDDDLLIWDVPPLEKAVIDTVPAEREDGLVVGKLGVDGGDKDMIVKLAQEIADGQHGNYDSLLIVHKSKLLFESYYLLGRVNLTHPQVSATKAYTALALGRAIQLGYLTMADLDKPLASFLKDLDPNKFVEGVERITLHKALTMRGGLRVSEATLEEFQENPNKLKGQGEVQVHFEKSEPITEGSQNFLYGNFNPELVMQVIEAVVPGTSEEFIKSELLGKMGITTYSWQAGVSGLPFGGWRSSITSRDMVKLGSLVTNKGKWNGEQLIPEAFVAKATSRILQTGDDDVFGGGKDVSNQGYGYFWWSADLKYDNKSYFSASAQGGGGQFIILIDKLDLMVVTTAHMSEVMTLQMVAERILPAFTQ
ncbi:CubicO group peptidase, beta-lactamase class C family [Alteromonadaceae bacterium Bs31]|nr:CubicO group peptidase, beta-lactamase class C family [Alteromonadaceae bacterium Bs31]